MFAWSRDWTTLLPLLKALSALHFQLCQLLKQCVMHCTADINFNKESGIFIDGKVQGYSFCPPKKYKPTKQTFWCTRTLQGMVRGSGRLDYSEFSNILPRAVKSQYFANGLEKCKVLGNFLDKDVENLEDHGCPKVQDLVDEEI